MNAIISGFEYTDACKDAAHSAYGAADYNWQELCHDPVASKIPLLPPFTEETARAKVQRAEDLWNTRDPKKVALAYTEDSIWRNRDQFIKGHTEIEAFLTKKWQKELDYKLKKELFLFSDNKIAVQFEYTWRDAGGKYYRAYGLEHWVFAPDGRMQKRTASINDLSLDRGLDG
jgi:nuclear transport factor 2 (NTF2) superfamily protein